MSTVGRRVGPRSLALAVVTAAVALTACGGGQQQTTASPTPEGTAAATPAPSVSPQPSVGARNIGVFVVRADGTGLKRVWERDSFLQAWSPDSKRLVFADRLSPGYDITVLDPRSGATTSLGQSTPATLAWSPDGGSLLVTAPAAQGTDRAAPPVLEIIDVRTGQRRRLAESIEGAWSPDGSRVTVAGTTCDSRFVRHIYDLATSTTTDLLPAYAGAAVFISPDWKRIAYFKSGGPFLLDPSADNTLYVANFDGSDEHALPTGGLGRGEPAWSPDGRWIAYTPRRSGANGFVYTPYLLSADGGRSPIKLAEQGDTGPWSPDSTMLVVHDARDPADQFDDAHVVYELTGDQTHTFETGPAYHERWSPLSGKLAFISTDGAGQTGISLYNVGSGTTIKVSGIEGIIPASPRWSPDGAQLSFLGIPGGYDYGPCL